MTLPIFAAISLALWVGGLGLFICRFLDAIFPGVDRWGLVWGTAAMGALILLFLNRHFALRSLVLEVPVAVMYLVTLHLTLVLHPEIYELKRKLSLPEFQGTAHRQTIQFAFNRLHRLSVQLHGIILVLGLLSLGLTPRFLR